MKTKIETNKTEGSWESERECMMCGGKFLPMLAPNKHLCVHLCVGGWVRQIFAWRKTEEGIFKASWHLCAGIDVAFIRHKSCWSEKIQVKDAFPSLTSLYRFLYKYFSLLFYILFYFVIIIVLTFSSGFPQD